MLLRKTRAESVEPVVREFVHRYPSWTELAQAPEEELADLLQPLGLHRIRAAAIRKVAERLIREQGGAVPEDLDALLDLPHVGRYTANAALCFGFEQPRPIVDANVFRVLSRLFDLERPTQLHTDDDLWELARELVPENRPREFNWALLDLGALLCTPQTPACTACPLTSMCHAHQEGSCGCDGEIG